MRRVAFRRDFRHGLLALVWLSAIIAPTGVVAQSLVDAVEEKYLDYGEAKSLWEAAFQAWQRVENQWDELLDEHESATEAEDEDRIDRARAQIQNLQGQRNAAISALNARKEEWYVAYDALLGVLHNYLDILIEALQGSPVGSSGEEQNLYTEYTRRLDEVDNEVAERLGPRHSFELPPMPDIAIREGDSPNDILLKARFIDRRVEQLERLVEDLDQEITYLVRRQRRNRTREDVRAGLNVFDDRTVPVVTPPSSNTDRTGVTGIGDTTAVSLARLPLEVRIENMTATREGLIDLIEQSKEKARRFREIAGGVS